MQTFVAAEGSATARPGPWAKPPPTAAARDARVGADLTRPASSTHAATTSASRSGSAGNASSEIEASALEIARLARASQRWRGSMCKPSGFASMPSYQVFCIS